MDHNHQLFQFVNRSKSISELPGHSQMGKTADLPHLGQEAVVLPARGGDHLALQATRCAVLVQEEGLGRVHDDLFLIKVGHAHLKVKAKSFVEKEGSGEGSL